MYDLIGLIWLKLLPATHSLRFRVAHFATKEPPLQGSLGLTPGLYEMESRVGESDFVLHMNAILGPTVNEEQLSLSSRLVFAL